MLLKDFKTGIYKITNLKNGKFYIGSSVQITRRITGHISQLNKNSHVNRHLQNAWNQYGPDSFTFERLERVKVKSKLLEREQYYLDTFLYAQEYIKGVDNRFLELGYNLNPIAGSNLGVRYSEESKKKMGEWERTPEMRKNMSAAQRKFYSDPVMREMSRTKMLEFYKNNPDRRKNGSKNGMAKPVYQYDFTSGLLVRKWDFANQIFSETGWTLQLIRENCNLKKNKIGEVIAFKDYVWSYVEINDITAYKSNNNILLRYKHRGTGDYHFKQ